MTFYTRIPFAFWIVAFVMAFVTYGVFHMPDLPIRATLITVLTLYWGFTALLIGLAFSR